MATTPDLHLVLKVDTSALTKALQDLERSEKGLEVIQPCLAFHPETGLQCLRMAHHQEMAGTQHKARQLRYLEGAARVEWLEWD